MVSEITPKRTSTAADHGSDFQSSNQREGSIVDNSAIENSYIACVSNDLLSASATTFFLPGICSNEKSYSASVSSHLAILVEGSELFLRESYEL